LLQRLQGLRDQIVDDLLQELKPAPAWGKMMRHFTRGHPPGPAIFCMIFDKSNRVKTVVQSVKPAVLNSFHNDTHMDVWCDAASRSDASEQ
jgi:hypothetical protein